MNSNYTIRLNKNNEFVYPINKFIISLVQGNQRPSDYNTYGLLNIWLYKNSLIKNFLEKYYIIYIEIFDDEEKIFETDFWSTVNSSSDVKCEEKDGFIILYLNTQKIEEL